MKSLFWPDWAPAAGSRNSQLRRPGHCVWLLRPEVIPYRLLLQPRAGLPDELPTEPGPVLAPLLADPLAVDDAITALRAGSLIRPPTGGMVSECQPRAAPPARVMSSLRASLWLVSRAARPPGCLPRGRAAC